MEEINCFGLTERDMVTIENILRKYPSISLIHIFGSRAKGIHKYGSDIDLAIRKTSLSEKEISKVKSDFEESSLPYTIDLVNYDNLENFDLKEHIDRVGKLFYQKMNE